jgi:methionine-rich copper-binding protein CopC
MGTVTYTWFASGSAVSIGSGDTFTLTQAQVGKTITAVGRYTDLLGTQEEVKSLSTVQIPTPDTTAPTVTSFNPVDGATAVAIASNIDLTFSEAILRGTGFITLHSGSAAGSSVESFDAATSNLLSIIGNTLTINPLDDLGNNTQYFVTFAAGSVKDLAGNIYAETTRYDFTTAVATNVTNGTVGNDKLVGTNASDTINGGKGADSMKGGLGSDTYYVDNIGDKVIESKSAGTDTVYSSISFILGSNVENLTLTGKTAINGAGNALNNILIGNSAANKLSGLAGNDILNGGLGKDILTGGTGKDIFQLTTLSKDTITDFSVKDDTLQLENSVFGKLIKTGVFSTANFKVGAATDNNDYVLYNSNTGAVSYDANGNGTGGATQIAVLGAHLALTHLDFFVI